MAYLDGLAALVGPAAGMAFWSGSLRGPLEEGVGGRAGPSEGHLGSGSKARRPPTTISDERSDGYFDVNLQPSARVFGVDLDRAASTFSTGLRAGVGQPRKTPGSYGGVKGEQRDQVPCDTRGPRGVRPDLFGRKQKSIAGVRPVPAQAASWQSGETLRYLKVLFLQVVAMTQSCFPYGLRSLFIVCTDGQLHRGSAPPGYI